MPYRAPVSEIRFLFDHVLGFHQLAETDLFADATPDTVEAVLTEAGRLSDEVLAPLNRAGDLHPARLENGVVRSSPGFAEGYGAIREGGWVAISGPQAYGGMGLPFALNCAVNDMMGAACLALHLSPLLTQGQIEALEHHASDAIKALYLPKLIAGKWTGTMNLTEPQAGSDVGALRTRAEPNGDGTYAITGQKIFISWADNDFAENVCHLVLARRAFEEQLLPLARSDFAALAEIMIEAGGIGLYNGGTAAGASQRHKHVQWMPDTEGNASLRLFAAGQAAAAVVNVVLNVAGCLAIAWLVMRAAGH